MCKRKLTKPIDKQPQQIVVVEMTSVDSGLKTTTNGHTFNEITKTHKDRFKDFKIIEVLNKNVVNKKNKPKKIIVESDFQKYKKELINEENKTKRNELLEMMGMK